MHAPKPLQEAPVAAHKGGSSDILSIICSAGSSQCLPVNTTDSEHKAMLAIAAKKEEGSCSLDHQTMG